MRFKFTAVLILLGGCSTFKPDRPEDCDGQDARWVELSYDADLARTINKKGYEAWVDETLGYGKENGCFKFVLVVPEGVTFPTILTVGKFKVRVTKAGSYSFLMEKGSRFNYASEPFDSRIKVLMTDDMAIPPFDPSEKRDQKKRRRNLLRERSTISRGGLRESQTL